MNPRFHNTAMKIRFGRPIFGAEMSPGMATRHTWRRAPRRWLGIQEIAGLFSEESVSLNVGVQNTAIKMGAFGPKRRAGVSCRPFRAPLG